jgi:hypothetical protein
MVRACVGWSTQPAEDLPVDRVGNHAKWQVAAPIATASCVEDLRCGARTRPGLVEVSLPICGHLPGRPGGRLARRVVLWRGERGSIAGLIRPVVVEPVLTGFEAADDPMALRPGVSARMLAGRGVATSNVPACGTAPQMEPPAPLVGALDASVATGGHTRIDQRARHRPNNTRRTFFDSVDHWPEAGHRLVTPRPVRGDRSGGSRRVWFVRCVPLFGRIRLFRR